MVPDGKVLSSLVNLSAAQVFSTTQRTPPSSGLTSEDSFQLRPSDTFGYRYRLADEFLLRMYVLRKSSGSIWRGDPEWAPKRRFFERGVHFGMSCTCNVRFVSVWRDAEPRRDLLEFVGDKVDAHNRESVWTVDGYLRACANLHRGSGERPITFLPLSRSGNVCMECERERA